MRKNIFFLTILILVVLFIISRKRYTLPKIIWTHWHNKEYPPYLEKNIANWRTKHPDWTVNLLTTEEFLNTVSSSEIPNGFEKLGHAHQADWIRLKLLKKYGGCWIDSGILLNTSINFLYDSCYEQKAELLLFKLNGFQTNPNYPVGENWFLMAPRGSAFVSSWLEEYEKAIRIGFPMYKKQLQDEKIDLQRIFNEEGDVYLTQHACFQKLLQRKYPNGRIVYFTAEESMFRLQVQCEWKRECLHKALEDKESFKQIPYVKLRGYDRENLDILRLLE
jgi:hypothetical protein